MIRKNILGVFNRFWDSVSRYPSPALADCISENNTPVSAVAAASFNPLKIDGSAAGIMTKNTVWKRLALNTFATFRYSFLHSLVQVTVLYRIVNNENKNTRNALD